MFRWWMIVALTLAVASAQDHKPRTVTIEIPFDSHDGYPMLGKLTLPDPGSADENIRHAVVIYVQTAEAMTVDMTRPLSAGRTFDYFDLYREKLPEMNIGFFSYEGRGVRMGEHPPRFETVEPDAFNTSTLDNKVEDLLSAVRLVQRQAGVDAARIYLMGSGEGTLIAADAATRAQDDVHGLVLYSVLSTNMKDALRYRASNATPANQGLVDAIGSAKYETIYPWLKTADTATTPTHWLEDHYAYPSMESFLSQLDIPVGVFQGEADAMFPVAGVKALQARLKQQDRTNFEFHYFDKLDQSLGLSHYFAGAPLPAGHQAIFEFLEEHLGKRD